MPYSFVKINGVRFRYFKMGIGFANPISFKLKCIESTRVNYRFQRNGEKDSKTQKMPLAFIQCERLITNSFKWNII